MSYEDDYTAVREAAALGELARSKAIGVSGRDRASYLQGLLTNDIQALTPGTGCYAAWLTPQGRMLTDLHVFESGDMLLLDVPSDEHAATLARLEQFLFSEDVQLADLSGSLRPVWVHGPAATALLEQVTGSLSGLQSWAQYQNARAEISGAAVAVGRVDQLGVPGFCVYADASTVEAVASALRTGGAVQASADAVEAARIDAAYPLFGVDMTTETIPLEAGIESRALSLTKGCYVGQEIIIRVLHRGQGRVARKLVPLSVEDAVPARGARVFSGEREVGWITSAARSPRRGPVALGYLHRDFLTSGTLVDVEVDGHRCVAEVTER